MSNDQVINEFQSLLEEIFAQLVVWSSENRLVREEGTQLMAKKFGAISILIEAHALGPEEDRAVRLFLICQLALVELAFLLGADRQGETTIEETEEIVDQVYDWMMRLYDNIVKPVQKNSTKLLPEEKQICLCLLQRFDERVKAILGETFRPPTLALCLI